MSKWCGYIDALGTRDAADQGALALNEHITKFHEVMSDEYTKFKDGNVDAFSDGAFFSTDDIDQFFEYFCSIRKKLIESGILFKCSFVPGSYSVDDELFSPNENGAGKFRCLHFTGDASRAFKAETQFNGIGCFSQLSEDINLDQFFTRRVFFVARGKKPREYSIREYRDVRLTDIESGEFIDRCFYYCHSAIVSHDHHSEKFLALFANAIRSSKFRDMRFVDGEFSNEPYIFKRLFTKSVKRGSLRKLPHLRLLYLALFDQYYHDNQDQIDSRTAIQIAAKISERRDCTEKLDEVPACVLSPSARKKLIESLGRAEGYR